MKKRILLLFVCMLALLFLNINAAADTTMYIECDIDSIDNPLDFGGKRKFARLTDNKGEAFYLPNSVDASLNTVPDLKWYKSNDEEISVKSAFNKGICPKGMVIVPADIELDDGGLSQLLEMILSGSGLGILENILGIDSINAKYFWLFGEKNAKNTVALEKPRYIIYSAGNGKKIAEGYGKNGAYAYVGPDIELSIFDEITGHQLKLINNEKISTKDYFKVDEVFDTLLIAGNGVTGDYSVCEGKTIDWCKNNKNFKIHVASSGEGKTNLDNGVKEWLDDNGGQLADYDDIITLTKDSEFIKTCEDIKESITNGTEHNISNINIDSFINKLEQGNEALTKAFNVAFTDCATGKEASAASSITSCVVYSDMLGIKEIVEIAEEDDSENILNQGFIIEALYNDVENSLKEAIKEEDEHDINVVDASSDLERYTDLFYTASVYLYQKAKSGHESLQEYEDVLKTINDEYRSLVEQKGLNINPVVDCETLLGDKLIKKIDRYLDIIKIAVPIILIGLGIFDFTKAIFAGEDEMKKAQKSFIKRLLVALLIFITPTIIHLLLQLANKVWTVISPGACGIF